MKTLLFKLQIFFYTKVMNPFKSFIEYTQIKWKYRNKCISCDGTGEYDKGEYGISEIDYCPFCDGSGKPRKNKINLWKFSIDIFFVDLWGIYDENHIYILNIDLGYWSGSLFEIYWDFSNCHHNYFDILFLRQFIIKLYEKLTRH